MMRKTILVLATVLMWEMGIAADRLYVGSTSSGDLTDVSNWDDGKLPDPKNDKAKFDSESSSGNNSSIPDTGLYLGGDLTLGAVEFNYRKIVPFDLKGHTLSFPDDKLYPLNINNNVKMTMHNGTVTNLSRLALNISTELNWTNITVYLRQPNVTYRYNSVLRVLNDATVYFLDESSGDQKFIFGENDPANVNPKTFIVDGGRVVSKSAGGASYKRLVIGGKTNCIWNICNNGRFDDYSPTPCILMNSARSRLLVTSGAELTMTNAIVAGSERNEHVGLVLGSDLCEGFVGVSNATLRTSRFNYLAKTENRCVFKDSTADFRYHGPEGSESSTTNASGLFFRNGSANADMLVTGSEGVFMADRMTFEAGSSGNSFEAEGGSLSVGLISANGSGNRLSFSGCTLDGGVQLNGAFAADRMTFEAGSSGNSFDAEGGSLSFGLISVNGSGNRLSFSGCTLDGGVQLDGVFAADRMTFEAGSSGNSFEAEGGSLSFGLISDNGSGNRLSFSGCKLNGGVQLKGENGVVTFGAGSVCTMPTRDKGLQFANDVSSGSKLIISNAQLECQGAICGSRPVDGTIWKNVASVYTNCPGSAIEFRGSSPCLKITSSWIADNKGYWFCAAFGSFAAGVLGTEPLCDPLALRFVLPKKPYAQAPLQGDAQTSSGGRPIVLAGNARIEVDAGEFRPTRNVYRMPLISDINNFTQANSENKQGPFFMLDIEALNRNNAGTLPIGSRLVYEKDGTTGRIDIVFQRGFAIHLR